MILLILKKIVNKKTICHTQMIKPKKYQILKLIMLETSYYYSPINAKIIWNVNLKGQEDSTLYAYYYK
jgi:hypothetical protein